MPFIKLNIREGDIDAVIKFRCQQMVADEQRIQHGLGRNFEGLHEKGTNKERQNQRNKKRLGIFQPQGFFVLLGLGILLLGFHIFSLCCSTEKLRTRRQANGRRQKWSLTFPPWVSPSTPRMRFPEREEPRGWLRQPA